MIKALVILALSMFALATVVGCDNLPLTSVLQNGSEAIFTGDPHILLLAPEDMPVGWKAEYPREPINVKDSATRHFVSVESKSEFFNVSVQTFPTVQEAASRYQEQVANIKKTYSVQAAGIGNESIVFRKEVETICIFRRGNVTGQIWLWTQDKAKAVELTKGWARKLDAKIRSKL